MVRRHTYKLRRGSVIDVEEYLDCNYGAPGRRRNKKQKASPEQVAQRNEWSKLRRCRQRLLEYFSPGDCFITLTYDKACRPENMKAAVRDFGEFRKRIARIYKKRDRELFWIRNIECGTRGAWHIHLVVNEIGDTASIVQQAWKKGGIYTQQISLNKKLYDKDFSKLASYMTKSERTRKKKSDGEYEKPRIRESSYSSSRNMPLPPPKKDKLKRWKKEVKPRKGYYISELYEGINEFTGFPYRKYTMIKLE